MRPSEAWSKALDLRDKETEGHTRRVTEMTINLARSLGLSETDLVHVRRGALLHDIGKMGIPDEILLKPGPLTDEEWVIMSKHPAFALNCFRRLHTCTRHWIFPIVIMKNGMALATRAA